MLVGRETERRTIDTLVAGARVGRSGILVVVGEAGIGKTTLLDYAAGQAVGMDVVRIVGSEAERDLAFGGLTLALAPQDEDLAQIPGPQARALRVALAMEAGQPVDRFAVGAATLSLLARRAEIRPVALLLDDAHHLDRPSAEAFVFAARRLVVDPILLLAALRFDEPSPLRAAGLPTVVVTGLDRSGTAALLGRSPAAGSPVDGAAVDRSTAVEAALGDGVDWVHRTTGGNPLAILELARDPLRPLSAGPAFGAEPLPVPAALAESFLSRARRAGPWTVLLLALCEVSGGDLRTVLRASEALGFSGPDALDAAAAAGLAETYPDHVVTSHPLVGSSAYADLSAKRRRALHAAVVDALLVSDLARRAWHRAAAVVGPDEGAARAVAEVGHDSRRRGAYAVAASAYERSAQLSPDDPVRAERLLEAADSAWSAGDAAWATRLASRAVELGVGPSSRGRALALQGAIAARGGSLERAWAVLVAAAREVAAADAEQAVHLVAEAVDVAFYRAEGAVIRETEQLAVSLVGRVPDGRAAGIGHLAVGMARILDGREGAEDLRKGIRLLGGPEARPSADLDARWLMYGVLFLREGGATRRLVRDVEHARADTAVGALPHLLFHLARDGAATDRWASAVSDYSEAIALADELGQRTEAAVSLAGLAWVEAHQGNDGACRTHAARALDLARAGHITLAEIWARHALGDLELAHGRVDAAVDAYGGLEKLLTVFGTRDVDLSPAPELVEALLRQGNDAPAEAVAHEHQRRATAKGQPWALARAGRVSGLFAAEEDLDATFEAALELHRQTADAFETARTQLVFGSRLRRARRRVDARPHLGAAHATFGRLGARPWADTAAAELEATGVTVPRRGVSGLDLLTPRERQIVSLLVEGRSTRETAGALFLSPKTVEYHLRHVYTKLGISSRAALGEVATASSGG